MPKFPFRFFTAAKKAEQKSRRGLATVPESVASIACAALWLK